MVICHCRAVSDQAIRAAIRGGLCDPEEVIRRCGAGDSCGGCLPALLGLLHELDARGCQAETSDANPSAA